MIQDSYLQHQIWRWFGLLSIIGVANAKKNVFLFSPILHLENNENFESPTWKKSFIYSFYIVRMIPTSNHHIFVMLNEVQFPLYDCIEVLEVCKYLSIVISIEFDRWKINHRLVNWSVLSKNSNCFSRSTNWWRIEDSLIIHSYISNTRCQIKTRLNSKRLL